MPFNANVIRTIEPWYSPEGHPTLQVVDVALAAALTVLAHHSSQHC